MYYLVLFIILYLLHTSSVPRITSTLSTPYYSDGNDLLIRVETVFTAAVRYHFMLGFNAYRIFGLEVMPKACGIVYSTPTF